ncbi:MAG TPA: outer membrane protein assembly factor BamA [Candidatus Eisenbacteria bacterium]|nr:outer membrane protein assembly factor BamA [Candidatus Eisenbacteria bacterium]
MSPASRLTLGTAVAAMILAAAVLHSPAHAQGPLSRTAAPTPVAAPKATFAGPALREVKVQGIGGEDSLRALSVFGLAPGTSLTAPLLREGLRRVWALEVADDLWAEGQGSDTSTTLILHIAPRPRIQRIEFAGNHKIKSDELMKKTALVTGSRLSPEALFAAIDSLKRTYREKGYVRADVRSDVHPLGGEGVDLVFTIDEGPSARVHDFAFEGATAFTVSQLSHEMASKKSGFLKSGKIDPDKLDKDINKLTDFYRSHGYRDVQVTRDSLRFSPDGHRITLAYHIEEGPRYHMGTVTWSGDKSLSPAQKAQIDLPPAGTWYNGPALKKAVDDTYAAYAENGFLYVSVDPQETVNDQGAVDVAFTITEGPPSHVRWVNITGNTRTKEKVVRREISIHEGDLFRRSALMRTQQDVFRLGFFNDVQVDFKPADSTDVDLYMKVVEKETGTASAGAGYSSEGGLTGFVQLGHNNLFGTGASISIALERGAKRNTYDISYTDPWFRDTRTTLGFSLFNRSQQTSVTGSGTTLDYNDTRRGGSIRVGRPLRKIDRYLHGFVTYRLEDVNIQVPGPDTLLTPAQKELESLIQQGRQLTSSMEFSFSRDNTNNPFYPTKGTRLNQSNEFAGRVLGGQVEFYKFEIDGRGWFPSLLKPVASMFRARTGLVGNYGGAVPQYERYRLGGTTFYGLRGYEDYEIVPDANIHTVEDSLLDPTDSTHTRYIHRTSQVRYPGGRVFAIATFEQQFPIVHPVHGLLFAEAGNTWNNPHEMSFAHIKKSAGLGIRVEVPLLGNMGLDFGYGFDKSPRPGWRTHFLLGNMFF